MHRLARRRRQMCNRAMGGHTFVTASAGNHGLSVASGAAVFGARAVVYLSDTVPDSFALRLRAKGAEVVRSGRNYEDSMQAAAEAAEAKGPSLRHISEPTRPY